MGLLIAGAAIMLIGVVFGYGMGSAKTKPSFISMEDQNRAHLKSVE